MIPALPELRLIGVDTAKAGLEGPRMSYMESGAGDDKADRDTVLLLHGIGSNSGGWRYVLDGLSAEFRVIAWNAPGYYLSDNLAAESPAHTQYADAAAALLDALGVASAHVAGSSFGSVVAASFAARYPQRVKRLALFGSSRGMKWMPDEDRRKRLQTREESIRGGGIALAQTRWKNLVAPTASATAIALVQQALAATHARGMLQAARAIDSTDVLDFAGGISAPTLLAVGSQDLVNPPPISRMIQAAIPGAQLVEIEGAGHLPKLETPQRVIALLREHFPIQEK